MKEVPNEPGSLSMSEWMPRISSCEGEPGHFCFQEGVPMNIGEPVRELEVEPLLAPAVMPAAPAEPSVAPQPDFEPVEVPD